MSDASPLKRRGRPPLPIGEHKKGDNVTFRARAGLREQLMAEAKKSNRSMSEEIEHRLRRSLLGDQLAPIDAGLNEIGDFSVQTWEELFNEMVKKYDNLAAEHANYEQTVERAVLRALEKAGFPKKADQS